MAMERAVGERARTTDKELARRLVRGQLMLAESDFDRAAIQFLDLVENHGQRAAGRQALYYLGESLTHLDMQNWAAECFTATLGSASRDARQLQQKALARLLDLAMPRRPEGFARQPGLSATPEFRARLEAIGVSTDAVPPSGVFTGADLGRLGTWAHSIPVEKRGLDLQYAYGRFLYLTGEHEAARDELDRMWPPKPPGTGQATLRDWWMRAGYVAAAAALAMGDHENAVLRFEALTQFEAGGSSDAEIVALSWMALGRIYHDQHATERAVAAYRQISRRSPQFAEAMYETAWTQLRAGAFEPALKTLDVLLVYAPDSVIVPEIKQLRGKLKIQQADWQGAEEEFIALRREFAKLSDALARQLKTPGEAAKYFASVAVEDADQFSLASVMPGEAVSMARRLPRALQAEGVAIGLGQLRRDLDDARALLARMEETVDAPQRARLFTDLGGHLAALDAASIDLIDLQEQLIRRAGSRARQVRLPRQLDVAQKRARLALEHPTVANQTRDAIVQRLEALAESIHKQDLVVTSLRAQLVATEQYYEQTLGRQRISSEGFLLQAAESREAIASLERRTSMLRSEARQLGTALRFSDPWHDARAVLLVKYRKLLAKIFGTVARQAREPEAIALWRRVEGLHQRIVAGYVRLDTAAGRRLHAGIRVLEEERGNLDAYLVELDGLRPPGIALVGEALEASYRDVVGEAENLVSRSEVGLLDVAWAIQEVEAAQIRRLEANRARDLEELERVLNQGLEELE